MIALPRGRCPVCGDNVALRKNGTMREHRRHHDSPLCEGSGQPAVGPIARPAGPPGVVARVRGYGGYRLPPGRRGSTT